MRFEGESLQSKRGKGTVVKVCPPGREWEESGREYGPRGLSGGSSYLRRGEGKTTRAKGGIAGGKVTESI